MTEGRERRQPKPLTPEQEQERFTAPAAFDESLRQVLPGGPDPDEGDESMSAVVEREFTEEEMAATIEATRRGVAEGTIPLFDDAKSLREDIRRRFNR